MSPILPLLLLVGARPQMQPPAVGEKAPAFQLKTLDGKVIHSGRILKQVPLVLVVLRGYPGYQCPFCTAQIGELLAKSDEFVKRKASVWMVYPGSSAGLDKYAAEFVNGKEFPKSFRFTPDPDYGFTAKYHLRWDAPNETAYPSTFVISKNGRIAYAKISHGHGDRAPLADVLAALDKLP